MIINNKQKMMLYLTSTVYFIVNLSKKKSIRSKYIIIIKESYMIKFIQVSKEEK